MLDLDAIEARFVGVSPSEEEQAILDLIARIREQDAEIARLRALCGEADHLIGLLYNSYHPDRMKFRAASKGEQ